MANDSIPEEWRPIDGLPNYEASSLGRIRSTDRLSLRQIGARTWVWRLKGKVLSSYMVKGGYLSVKVGAHKRRLVHNLVCIAFHGARPSPKHEVAHWDGNSQNNIPKNLRWATPKENQSDKLRHGTDNRGLRHPNRKLMPADVLQIKAAITEGASFASLGRQYGVRWQAIQEIAYGRNWGWLTE